MAGYIFHITSLGSWTVAQKSGTYSASSLASEGYIHCCKLEQTRWVANAFYANQHGLVILVIDLDRLKSEVRWETSTDKADELFPHIYGPIHLDAVSSVIDFEPGKDGKFTLPPSLRSGDDE